MVEQAKYGIFRRIGDVEIRGYAGLHLATVTDLPDNEAFGILFRYITGNNRSAARIAMTSPVVSGETNAEEIAMTAPVMSDGRTFSFVLPATYTRETVPIPLDSRVRIDSMKPRCVAVLRFRGRTRARRVERKTNELLGTLREQGIATKGPPFLMRYNPPFTPGFLRRNEVGVEVEA